MPEYEKDTLYRPETKKSGSLAYKIGQAIAILMSLCARNSGNDSDEAYGGRKC